MPIDPQQARKTAGISKKVIPLSELTHLVVGQGSLDIASTWGFLFCLGMLMHQASSQHQRFSNHEDWAPATSDNSSTTNALSQRYFNQTLGADEARVNAYHVAPISTTHHFYVPPVTAIAQHEETEDSEELIATEFEAIIPPGTQFVIYHDEIRFPNPFILGVSYKTPWIHSHSFVPCSKIIGKECVSYLSNPTNAEYKKIKAHTAQAIRDAATKAKTQADRYHGWVDLSERVLDSLPVVRHASIINFMNKIFKELEGLIHPPILKPFQVKGVVPGSSGPEQGQVITPLPKNAKVFDLKSRKFYIANDGPYDIALVIFGNLFLGMLAYTRKKLASFFSTLTLRYRKRKIDACYDVLRLISNARIIDDTFHSPSFLIHLPTTETYYRDATLDIHKNYNCNETLDHYLKRLPDTKIIIKTNDKKHITNLFLNMHRLTKQEFSDLLTQIGMGLELKPSIKKNKQLEETQKEKQQNQEEKDVPENKAKKEKAEQEKKKAKSLAEAEKKQKDAQMAKEKAEQQAIKTRIETLFKVIGTRKSDIRTPSQFKSAAEHIQSLGGKLGEALKEQLEVRHAKYIDYPEIHRIILELRRFYSPRCSNDNTTNVNSGSSLSQVLFPAGHFSTAVAPAPAPASPPPPAAPVVAPAPAPAADASVSDDHTSEDNHDSTTTLPAASPFATNQQTLFSPPMIRSLKPIQPWDKAAAKTICEEALELHHHWGNYWLLHNNRETPPTDDQQLMNKSTLVYALARILRRIPWAADEHPAIVMINKLVHHATYYVFREHDQGNKLMDFLQRFFERFFDSTEVTSDAELKTRVKLLLSEKFISDMAAMSVKSITTKQHLEMIQTCLQVLRDLAINECRIQENYVGMTVLIGEIWNVIRGNRDFDKAFFEITGCRDSEDFCDALIALSVNGRDPYLHAPTPIFEFKVEKLNQLLACVENMSTNAPALCRAGH